MLKKLTQIFTIAAVLGLAACNTIEGAGKDIESAGNAIEEEAQ